MDDLSSQFLKGVAISVWQNSSDEHSNWADFVRAKRHFGRKDHIDAFKQSNDFWNQYEEDIDLAAKLGCTSFRLSLEWARIEPARGRFDSSAVARYQDILRCLKERNLVPMVTLHHFTHPLWFEKLGGFENEENIHYFVEYCSFVFQRFGSQVRLWSTFNEPTCYTLCGYIVGVWSPGRSASFKMAGQVLLNLLKAHVEAYQCMKTLPGGSEALIGIVHQHCKFVPQKPTAMSAWYTRSTSTWLTYFFGTTVLLEFFQTGKFEWRAPMWGSLIKHTDTRAPSSLDWWGVNYYSRPTITWQMKLGGMTAGEPLTDMDFPLYPQGLYSSIQEAASLGRPIYITETGIADSKDQLRAGFIRSHVQEVIRAVQDGYDVRGMYYWTLMDNIEWHLGFTMKFGLYEFCPLTRRSRGPPRLREGARMLPAMYNLVPDSLEAIRAGAADLLMATDSLTLTSPSQPLMLTSSASAPAELAARARSGLRRVSPKSWPPEVELTTFEHAATISEHQLSGAVHKVLDENVALHDKEKLKAALVELEAAAAGPLVC